ncbi:hypothetical protein [Tianweitania sp.]|uniref:hypothetical protein n=1 Tax=Tianweitania sp. TaxID=2021634 RepID=UPI0028A09CD5|nr:hypothetical protein [Tianweitania sp.]
MPSLPKLAMSQSMEALFGKPAYRRFTLQDRKRLPGRFFAHVCGASTARLI